MCLRISVSFHSTFTWEKNLFILVAGLQTTPFCIFHISKKYCRIKIVGLTYLRFYYEVIHVMELEC